MQHMALYFVLDQKQRELDQSLGFASSARTYSDVLENRKSSYQFYKLWGKDCMSGPLHIIISPLSEDLLAQRRVFLEWPYDDVLKIYGKQNFFIKFIR
jgi:hypothetical protein